MSQKLLKSKPVYVDTDTADIRLGPNAGRYLKNYRNNFNKNPSGSEGGNFGVGTPLQSTLQTVKVNLPNGINKKIGGKEFVETNEYYYMNWNSNQFCGIYRINGKDNTCDLVMVDPILNFSLDPVYQISADRIALRVIYVTDENGLKVPFEKFLVFTDKNNWQYWINVESAIATKGYNATDFPYFTVNGPFFDRSELIQYASRPPLFPPAIAEIPYAATDIGKTNHLLKTATQFAYRYIYIDGRTTALSAYSEPYYLIQSACNINNEGLSRGLNLMLYAGSVWVEKIQIFKRNCNGDFVLYDTIFKFDTCGANDPELIEQSYWLRTNPWAIYGYNQESNSITYPYYGDKDSIPFDNTNLGDTFFQTSLPIKSAALSDAGDAVLLSNNLKNYNNFDCNTINNIQLKITQPTNTDACAPTTVKISAYAYIGEQGHANQVVYHNGTDTVRRFGGINYHLFPKNPITITEPFSQKYNLTLNANDGFIGYLAGTPYFAIGQQYICDGNGNLTFAGVIDSSNQEQLTLIFNTIQNGGFFVQKFDFTVPAGNYIFRIANHISTDTSNFQSTSTYIYYSARHEVIRGYWGNNILPVNRDKEIEIAACAGNVDLWNTTQNDMLIIYTPPPIGFISTNERFIDGYFTESETSTIGWEGALYYQLYGNPKQAGAYTDHNGFFWAYCAGSGANDSNIVFSLWANCSYKSNYFRTLINQNGVSGYFTSNVNWADNNGGIIGVQNQLVITGSISNCNGGAGISGVGITPNGTGTVYTNGTGEYTIITHPRSDPTVSEQGSKNGRIYFNAGGLCLFTECDCSCAAITPFDFGVVSCINSQPINYPTPINKNYKLVIGNIKALKGGGRYGVNIVGFDDAERANFANLIDYIDIPTFLETGVFSPSSLSWNIIGNLKLPPWVRSVSFFLTNNLNLKSYLQWVGDAIAFIDTDGNIVPDGLNAIRAQVTIQSLLDFNLANNFATTVDYQFVPGDIVRFYDDGSGNLFKPDPITGFMDYQILGTNFNESVQGQIATQTTTSGVVTTQTVNANITESNGKTFYIDFDSRLLALMKNEISACGFWIELIRPRTGESIEICNEVAQKYPVVNGELANNITTGVINAFDTYYQNRNIIIALCGGKTFLHPFESLSITDYWGANCPSYGRVTVHDPEVVQYWDETETTKSDEVVNNGRVNGMGTFRGKTSRFQGQQRGQIVAVHVETKIILFICTNDVFVTDYNNKFVQTEANSGFVTATLDEVIGDPSKKAGITHGCAEEDRGTLVFEKGLALWLDRKNSTPVVFDYEQGPYKSVKPEDIAEENKSWFLNKVNYMVKFNASLTNYLTDLMETNATYDPKNNDYVLSIRPRYNLNTSPNFFVNNERESKIPLHETFTFNLDQRKWSNFTGYVPEGYGVLRGAISGMEMISFVNGLPYYHNTENFANFNTFYGIKTQTVIDLAFSGIEEKLEDKAKVFQSLLLQLKGNPFYVDKITTSKPTAFSYIPLVYWIKKFNIWFTTILGDGNTYPDAAHPVPSQLIDGSKVNGFYTRVRICSGPETSDQYFELEKIAIRICGSEKTDK